MGQFHFFEPEQYRAHVRAALPAYDRVQDEVAAATEGVAARAVLELGVGTGTGRFQDPLPAGPFDLAVSAFAVHHLDAAGKADLFARLAAVLAPGARFVLADVVVPDDPADTVTPLDGGYDLPDPVSDQLRWLADAGFAARASWAHRDMAVVSADLRTV